MPTIDHAHGGSSPAPDPLTAVPDSGSNAGAPTRPPAGCDFTGGCLLFGSTGVVLAIAVAALFYGRTLEQQEQRRERQTRMTLESLMMSLKLYESKHAAYPPGPNEAMVQALLRTGRGGPFLDAGTSKLSPQGALLAAWGTPFAYRAATPPVGAGTARPAYFTLYSWGPNEKDEGGKGDDIDGSR